MKPELKQFIEENIDLIENNDFETLYKKIKTPPYTINFSARLTKSLLSADVNPMLYVTELPYHFAYCSTLEHVVIPGNVKRIGINAFSDSKSLQSVIIQEGVTTIGQQAFEKCHKNCHFVLPESLTSVNEWAFGFMENITIEYNGTKKQFKELINKTRYVFDHTFYTCTCLDGVIEKKRRTK